MDKDYKPVYLQIVEEMKRQMVTGKLSLGDKLPSIRDVALEFKVNPNTVQRSFRELETQELIETKRGIGSYVTQDQNLFTKMREELLQRKLRSFLEDMQELRVDKKELLKRIEEEHYE